MFKFQKAHMRAMAAAVLMALPALASAQGYYDDDIYYNGSKAEKQKKSQPAQTTSPTYNGGYSSYTPTADYPSADTYSVNTGSTIDVDTYNRHGAFLVADTSYIDTTEVDYFANTRRLEKFHNPDVVSGSNDETLQAYYYTQPSSVNIYVNSDPWYFPTWSWTWTFGNPLYNWAWGYYDPWWNPVWGWTWTPGWGPGWGPAYYPGWGPAWGPAWGPGWGPSWGPGWHPGPGHGAPSRPVYTGGGSSRPHNPAFAGGSTSRPSAAGSAAGTIRPGQNIGGGRPSQSGSSVSGRPNGAGASVRPGQATSSATASGRPAAAGADLRPSNVSYGSARPAQTTDKTINTRPSQSTVNASPAMPSNSTGTVRGRNNAGSNSSSGYTPTPSNNRNSSGYGSSNRSTSGSSTRSSGSSYNSGSRSSGGYSGGGHSSGGGSHSSGGGSGRGRR